MECGMVSLNDWSDGAKNANWRPPVFCRFLSINFSILGFLVLSSMGLLRPTD